MTKRPSAALRPVTPGAPRGHRKAARRALLSLAILGCVSLVAVSAGFSDRTAAKTTLTASQATCSTAYTTAASDTTLGAVKYVGSTSGHWSTLAALCSPNGRWQAVYQPDGNVVLYDMSLTPGKALWNSWTFGAHLTGKATKMVLRANGELVILDASNKVLRTTGTAGIPVPAKVTLSNGPVMTITDANGTVRWTSSGAQNVSCKDASAFVCDPATPL